jgi:mRNA interferase RelE/StbE
MLRLSLSLPAGTKMTWRPKLEDDPLKYGTPLGNKYGLNLSTLYKITPLDEYRVIYFVQKNEVLVIVITIGKREREKVYKTAAQRIERFREMTMIQLRLAEN